MARVEVTTDKEIRPDQLKNELRGKDIYTSKGGVVQAEGVTKAKLQAAVDKHVPKVERTTLKERLNLSDEDIAELKALLNA